jgi:Ca2+:H+ antiporter
MKLKQILPIAYVLGPIVSFFIVIYFWATPPNTLGVLIIAVVLVLGVSSSVHHAEVISAFVGRSLGALVLALAVTVIEVALIVSIMLASDGSAATLGRDTIFAAVMITTNGIIGISVVTAALRQSSPSFNSEGSGAALSAIGTIATLSLVLPTFTRGSSGPTLTVPQMIFVAIISLGVYSLFLYVLTVRNREHFEDYEAEIVVPYALKPEKKYAYRSLALLLISLTAIIGLSKVIAPSIEGVVKSAGLPLAFVAVAVALVVLAPETLAATRSAKRGDLQSSFNFGYGSALASIGLTIPTLAFISLIFDIDLYLGLGPTEIVLFALTLIVSVVTVSSHRVTLFQGGLHLVIFSAFIFLALSP